MSSVPSYETCKNVVLVAPSMPPGYDNRSRRSPSALYANASPQRKEISECENEVYVQLVWTIVGIRNFLSHSDELKPFCTILWHQGDQQLRSVYYAQNAIGNYLMSGIHPWLRFYAISWALQKWPILIWGCSNRLTISESNHTSLTDWVRHRIVYPNGWFKTFLYKSSH